MVENRLSRKDIGILLLSSSVLSFEITLTRLFAIQQFHHFGFLVVSLAVLGIAASGIPLSALKRQPSLTIVAAAYAISIVAAYAVINYLPFDSYAIAWDRTQLAILFLYFLSSAIPFFFAGWGVGLYLASSRKGPHRPYAINLLGSATGCLLAMVGLSAVGAVGNVLLCVSFGTLAAAAFSLDRNEIIAALGISLSTVLVAISLPSGLDLNLSPYKPLSITRLTPDAILKYREETLSARVDMIESTSVHIFPGLSLNTKGSPPSQAALFVDGDGPIPATKLSSSDPAAVELSAHMPSSLAFQLREDAEVLIIDPGAGLEALISLAAGAKEITLPRDQPLLFNALVTVRDAFALELLTDPRITRSSRSGRGLLASDEHFDIILFALTDNYRPITSGAFSLRENYTLTADAFSDALNHLTDDGLLVITRWLGTPPSEAARAWATLLNALTSAGIHPLADHSLAFRGMRTATMIASVRAFDPQELRRTREFLHSNAFDPIHLPDLKPAEVNRFNRLPEDVYYRLFQDLLDDPERAIQRYPYRLQPPTDNQPFFHHFFRWRQTPEVIAELGLRWEPFGGSGYLVILALLGLILLLALPLSLVPLLVLKQVAGFWHPSIKTLGFFIVLGAGYLMVEIPLIQKFTLLFVRPSIAFTIVLFCMLLSSGVGSLFSIRVRLRPVLVALVIYLLLLSFFVSNLIGLALPLPLFPRIALTIATLFPAGFLMGIPFASGLRALERESSHHIPWAWAVNGGASAVAGVFSAMLSLEFGLSVSLLAGTGAYVFALLTWFGHSRSST